MTRQRITSIVLLIGTLLLFLPLQASSQTVDTSRSGRLYNPASEQTVTGQIVAIQRMEAQHRFGYGLHLVLKVGEEELPVHLGPGWYFERNDFPIAEGDTLQVTGSRITLEDGPALIAAELRKGDKTLRLRNEQGIPLWSNSPR